MNHTETVAWIIKCLDEKQNRYERTMFLWTLIGRGEIVMSDSQWLALARKIQKRYYESYENDPLTFFDEVIRRYQWNPPGTLNPKLYKPTSRLIWAVIKLFTDHLDLLSGKTSSAKRPLRGWAKRRHVDRLKGLIDRLALNRTGMQSVQDELRAAIQQLRTTIGNTELQDWLNHEHPELIEMPT